jgi:hypothetical protein
MSFKAFAQRTNPIKTTKIKSNNPWEPGQKVQLKKDQNDGIGTITTFEIAQTHWSSNISNAYGHETVWVFWPKGHAGPKPLQSSRDELVPVA